MTAATAVSFLLIGSVDAQVSPEMPPELKSLKDRFDKEFDAATRPPLERYASSLQSLLQSLTKRGDLKGALAVQNELDAIKAKLKKNSDGFVFEGKWALSYAGTSREVTVTDKDVRDMKGRRLYSWRLERDTIKVTEVDGVGSQTLTIDKSSPRVLKGVGQTGVPVRWEKIE